MGRPSHRHPAPNGDSFCSGALTSSHIADTTGASKIFFCDSETGCRDSDGYVIEGQASPALLNSLEDVEPIADFVRQVSRKKAKPTAAEPISA